MLSFWTNKKHYIFVVCSVLVQSILSPTWVLLCMYEVSWEIITFVLWLVYSHKPGGPSSRDQQNHIPACRFLDKFAREFWNSCLAIFDEVFNWPYYFKSNFLMQNITWSIVYQEMKWEMLKSTYNVEIFSVPWCVTGELWDVMPGSIQGKRNLLFFHSFRLKNKHNYSTLVESKLPRTRP